MRAVVILGAGDHGRQVLEVLRVLAVTLYPQPAPWHVVGFVDPQTCRTVDGVAVVGTDEDLAELQGTRGVTHFVVGLGSTGSTARRQAVYDNALATGLEPVGALVHPTAIVAPSVTLGRGSVVLAGAILQRGCVLEENVLVNTGAQADHECRLGAHAHLAPGAILCGGVRVGRGGHVGAGAVVREYRALGEGAIIGMGAVVIRDVPARGTVVGNPARLLRKGED